MSKLRTAFCGALVLGAAASADTIYFADFLYPDAFSGHIFKINTDGGGLTQLVDTGSGIRSLTVDKTAGKLYWSDISTQIIHRANLDGSNVEDIVAGAEWPRGLSIDESTGRMYWGDQVAANLNRIDTDGTDQAIIRSTAFHSGVALDTVHGKLYWDTSISMFTGNLLRSNLDGTVMETIVSGLDKPSNLAVDPVGGKIYWVDYVVDIIRRSNLDGTNIEDLYAVGSNRNPRGITLDLTNGKVYWGQDIDIYGNTGKIMVMDLDGLNPQDVAEGFGEVVELVFVAETPSCFGDLDGDNSVGLGDLAILLSNYGLAPATYDQGDLNGDQTIDLIDLAAMLAAYGVPCS